MKQSTDYPISRPAYYRYTLMSIGGHATHHTTRVDVIGETPKQYHIRLQVPIGRHFVGDLLWVRRKNIAFCRNVMSNQFPVPEGTPIRDTTGAWWQR